MRESIGDESIDLTVTSPPYDDLRVYDGYTFDYIGVIDQLFRVTKKGGVVVWVIGDRTTKGGESLTSFRHALFAQSVGFSHETMIYHRPAMPQNARRYEQHFEYMFVWVKGTRPKTWNPIMEPSKYAGVRTSGSNSNRSGRRPARSRIIKPMKVKSNIWSYSARCSGKNHPAPFPDDLARDHIASWSNAGGTVFDPMMGSGTTGVQALKLGRNFIGIDISQRYVADARAAMVELTQ